MQINIASPHFSSDPAAMAFVDELENRQSELLISDSILYYEFPLFKEIDEAIDYPSFMLISPLHGIIIIQCDDRSHRVLNEVEIEKLYKHTEQIYSSVFGKLIKIERLRRGRNQLKIGIHTVLYLPNYERDIEDLDFEELYIINSYPKLIQFFNGVKDNPIPNELLNEMCAVIEGTKGIPKPKDRNITKEKQSTKGGILEQLEKEIATFDEKQKIAALTQIDGPQRIRGLAGSGKTVVLAMKAALIHMKNPDKKILYTFYTKSLYDHIKHLITRFYRLHEDRDPNWDKLHIRHAWGGQSLPGVYYDACVANGVVPVRYAEARSKSLDPFEYVCKDFLYQTKGEPIKMYDYIFMDEGQDFNPAFYWLCRKIVRDDCLVWAYDELQNILHVEMQETEKLFENEFGDSGINLSQLQEKYPRQNNDIVLHKCYRNPKELLVISHAVGFGIYNDRILQKLENKEHWQDVGYEVIEGNCVEGEETTIYRPDKNSPSTISSKQNIDEIIKWYMGQSFADEIEWVCKSIVSDMQENLLPEDVLIVCLDDRNARRYFRLISERLMQYRIRTNNILESYTGDEFIVEGCVTLSTVYRAKGNEAAVVYVVGTDTFNLLNKDDITERNKLFTAFTRSKAWLRISGANDNFAFLIKEIKEAIKNLPNLKFRYPGEIKTLRRELAEANEHKNKMLRLLAEKLDELGVSYDEAIDFLRTERKDK